jgi:hypothetical protein
MSKRRYTTILAYPAGPVFDRKTGGSAGVGKSDCIIARSQNYPVN